MQRGHSGRVLGITLTFGMFAALALTARADTLLVGTDLSTTHTGPVLCPQAANCSIRFGEFTSPTPFEINAVSVAVSGPVNFFPMPLPPANFSVYIFTSSGNPLSPNYLVGSGQLDYDAQGDPISAVFTFSGLDIDISPDLPYYIEINGGNLMWNSAIPLSSTLGSLGGQYSCDPYQNCSDGRWDQYPGYYAEQISGAVITPEPSSLILLETALALLIFLSTRRNLTV